MAKKRILIIEDDEAVGLIYKTKLEQEGFIVLVARDGASGLELAIQEKPDLIMLDIIMPQLDGFSVLQELKLNKGTKNIPIIMLTNLGTDEDKKKGKGLGATDYWVKANFKLGRRGFVLETYSEKNHSFKPIFI